MAEKTGKVASLSRDKRPAPNSSSGKDEALKGKNGGLCVEGVIECEDSSDSEGSPRVKNNASLKSGGKFSSETPGSKGDSGKGGKADHTGKSVGKSSAPIIPSIPKLNVKNELPKNAVCLMDCEAADILQGIQDQLVVLSDDSAIKLPGSFEKGLQYAKLGSHYTSPSSVRKAFEILKSHKISDGEMCMIGNICPETADELFALIPSLKDNRFRIERAVKDMLSEMAKLKSIK